MSRHFSAATEADVGRGARLVVSAAEEGGFYVTATVAVGPWFTSTTVRENVRSVLLKGQRGEEGRFCALYLDGAFELGYWWTRSQRVTATLPDGVVEWETDQPLPHRVNATELKRLLRSKT